MLDLTRIHYFQSVADAGSFSRAARRLGVSQPTLSIQVARLEEELGTPLFQRQRRGVLLTDVGRRLLAQAQELLARIEAMERSVRADVDVPSGDLRIGTVHSVGIYLLPEALAAFTARYPKVRPRVRFEHSDTVLDLLEANEIDLAITARPRPPTGAHDRLVMDDPLVLVCGPGHRLWRRRYVRARDLQGEGLIGFDAQAPTARLIERVLARHGVQMRTLMETPQIAALVRMVRMNMGLAFVPQVALSDELAAGRLHALHFAADDLHRGIWASWHGPEEFPARAAFLVALQEVAREKGRSPRD